jgi:hypothetical protein
MATQPPETPPAIKAPSYSVHAIHLVRTATQANIALSQMADQKASILMAATFVVFTITVGQASHGQASASLLILAFFAFLSAMCAIAAVLPAVKPPARPEGDANLLFFGVFAQMKEDDFADRMLAELRADERIFRTMLRDIHQNGLVLQRKKYRYLGLAYRIFLLGLTLTFVTFLIEQSGIWVH